MREYPSSLTENEREILEPLLPAEPLTLRGRPQLHTKREILNGILYILRTGGAWRMMPHDLPHCKTCYHYFRLWAKQGWWKKIHDALRDRARLKSGKKTPTAAILDSQSVRTASQPGVRGYDAGKKITGRKRHILVDTQGKAGKHTIEAQLLVVKPADLIYPIKLGIGFTGRFFRIPDGSGKTFCDDCANFIKGHSYLHWFENADP